MNDDKPTSIRESVQQSLEESGYDGMAQRDRHRQSFGREPWADKGSEDDDKADNVTAFVRRVESRLNGEREDTKELPEIEPTREPEDDGDDDAEDYREEPRESFALPASFKELESDWEEIPASVKRAIIKREKEMADGEKIYRERADVIERTKELDPLLANWDDVLKLNNTSRAHFVEDLLSWYSAILDPNTRLHAMKTLAYNLNIDLDGVNGRDFQDTAQQFDLYQRQLKAARREQRKALGEAQNKLDTFGRDKRHLSKVGPTMAQILANGSIPLTNGELDLETAYQRALKVHDLTDEPRKPAPRTKIKAKTEAQKLNGRLKAQAGSVRARIYSAIDELQRK